MSEAFDCHDGMHHWKLVFLMLRGVSELGLRASKGLEILVFHLCSRVLQVVFQGELNTTLKV